MIKHLPVFILLLCLFTVAKAQSSADSTKNLPASVIEKIKLVDTIGKRPVNHVFVKYQSDDTASKQIIRDTFVKSPVVRAPADSVAETKPPAGKKTTKHTTTVKATSQPSPAVQHSPIKTLSDYRYSAYLKGDDLDSMALVGELNHYPSPDHVLKYKAQIGLNPGQITKLKDLAAALHRKRVEMGGNIIRNEKMLDSLFHSKKIIDGTLIFYTNRSGLYFGELKGAILMACYETEKILSDDQIRKLEALEKSN